jgi:CRP-like cAMP-binding protein
MPVKRGIPSVPSVLFTGPEELKFSVAVARILDSSLEEQKILSRLDGLRFHEIVEFDTGDKIFGKGSHAHAWYLVLQGSVASDVGNAKAIYRHRQKTVSGAGLVQPDQHDSQRGLVAVVASVWGPCNVFGYTDMLLDRPRTFAAVVTQDGTKLVRVTKSHMNEMLEEWQLSALIYQALLRASVLDLQNCTCDDV